MTNKELEKQVAELQAQLLKKSVFRQIWNWVKPEIMPLVCGIMLGGAVVAMLTLAVCHPYTLEKQAATGGAAIPFPSGSPLPSLLYSPLGNWIEEPTDSSLTSTSEESSPSNPQADNGQKTSTQYYRVPPRRRR